MSKQRMGCLDTWDSSFALVKLPGPTIDDGCVMETGRHLDLCVVKQQFANPRPVMRRRNEKLFDAVAMRSAEARDFRTKSATLTVQPLASSPAHLYRSSSITGLVSRAAC
jgi:hypothetical protein